MKNFTNNFKQFTSRLSARWLIMALMLLLGTSSAWAANINGTIYFEKPSDWTAEGDIYFCVGHSSYSEMNHKMTHVCGNYYKIQITWSGATQIAFTKTTDPWGSNGNENLSQRLQWVSGNHTNVITSIGTNRLYTSSGSYTTQSSDPTCVTTYTVKKSETGGTGTVTLGGTAITTGGVSISSGSKTLSITAPTGYNVSTVTVSGGSLTTPGTTGSSTYSGTVNVTAATTITITYVAKTYTVKKSETGGTGTVTLGGTAITTGGVSISYGSKALSITAPTGYNVSTVTVSGGSLTTPGTTGSSTYSGTVNVTAATTITITYVAKTFTVKKSETGGTGTVTLGGTAITTGGVSISYGSKALSITAPTGYNVSTVTVSGGSLTAAGTTGSSTYSGTVNVTAATTITITYVAKTFTVKKSETGGTGTVTLGGTAITTGGVSLSYGSKALSITAPTGYNVSTVTVSGGSLTTAGTTGSSTYSGTVNVTAATTITITYVAQTYTITYKDQGNVTFSGTHANGYPTTHTYGTATALKTATKSGYNFLGWFTTSACTGNAITQLTANGYTSDITLYAKWECAKSVTAGTGSFSNGTITLSAKFNTCGSAYIGFQWKKQGDEWCYTNDGTETCYIALGQQNLSNAAAEKSFTKINKESLSGTYVFRPYIVVGNDAEDWLYGDEFTVTACITVATPDIDPVAICAGSTATLTLKHKQNDVIYKIGDTPIFTGGTTHEVKPNTTTTYTITATSTNSCVANQTETTTVEVEVYELPDAPTINEETTVCPNTEFKLPSIGDGKWYAQAKGGSAYLSNTITNGVAATTYYYAEAVKYGCASATRTQYTVNVHTTPVAPVISLNPATVGQDKNSVLSISNETYSPSNTKYELYKGSDKVGEMLSQTTNVSSSNVGDVIYSVKATHKECTALTSTSNEVTLTVQEAGAIIAALGDLKVDPQDPVDFVAMYVKNDGLSDFTAQGATKVTGYTWEYSSDEGSNWTACASTNAVAGATYSIIGMENGSKNCNNFRPSAPGKYRCKVTYDKGEQTSNVLTVTGDGSTAKTFKGVTMNIPVISVNTGKEKFPTCDGLSGTASKNADVIKEKISVDVKIFAKVGENIEVVYDRKARMNYRGSSSLNFVKKSYAFCTAKEKTKNDKGAVDTGKENLFDLSNGVKDKDWVLYAAAADPSIMRNRLMFDTFRDMTGGWSVNSMYVELVINGEYKGVYVLMDKITANMGDEEVEKDGRVEVEWKLDKQGNTTQEGFIVKFDKTDIVDRYENTSGDQKTFKSTYSGHDGFTTYDTQIDQRFEVEYPEKEDIEEEDLEKGQQAGDWSVVFNSIKDKFNKFEKELKEGNFTEVQKLIDYQSWADWFIITEFAKNIDGYRASNLFVYDGSKPNAKIEARPLWDQELSFDNQCPNYYASYGANSEEGLIVENSAGFDNDASTPFWFTGKYKGGRGTYNGSNQTFKGLLDDPCFVAMVKTRWDKHKADALSEDKLNAKVTAYTTEMGAAKDREATFWSTRSRETCQCSFSGTTGYVYVSFTDSKNAITNWIKKRPAGLTKAIDALKGLDLTISLTVTPDGGITTPWEAVMVQVNNPSGYDYDFEYTTNSLDQVEGVIIQESNDKYTYRIPRPSEWGTGDGERAAIEYGIEASLKVGEDSSQCGSDLGEKLTKATATITLTDEENDGCTELTD